MALSDIMVDRIYKCHNPECACILQVTQGCGENFLSLCPFCETENLLLESGKCSIACIMELSKPKTLGSLGELNMKNKLKNSGPEENKKSKPWWRSSDKVNTKILKDPVRYINEGKV